MDVAEDRRRRKEGGREWGWEKRKKERELKQTMDRLCISFDNDEEKHSEMQDTSIINPQITCHRANFIKLHKYIYIGATFSRNKAIKK